MRKGYFWDVLYIEHFKPILNLLWSKLYVLRKSMKSSLQKYTNIFSVTNRSKVIDENLINDDEKLNRSLK